VLRNLRHDAGVPWLPMYLFEDDVDLVVTHLDDDTDLAWLVRLDQEDDLGLDDDKSEDAEVIFARWIAREHHPPLTGPEYMLWHVPNGPLPLPNPDKLNKVDRWVANPWAGWQERVSNHGSRTPWFGPDYTGTFELELARAPYTDPRVDIGMSHFGWTGHKFANAAGLSAPRITKNRWAALRRFAAKNATRIPRSGPIDGPIPEIHAFPAALEAIKNGAVRDSNPL
jgi:hypothetical protein